MILALLFEELKQVEFAFSFDLNTTYNIFFVSLIKDGLQPFNFCYSSPERSERCISGKMFTI